ncbi:MAG: cupredoxin domain-containing protein [bacterium]
MLENQIPNRMRRNEIIAVILVIVATIVTITGVIVVEKYRRSKFYTVELVAREPANGNWYPRKITVPYGEKVRLLIRNIETVNHGFALPAFKVAVNEIKAGEVAVVEFKADKRGTFPFMCTVWCSIRHMEMTGELTIK